MGLPGYACNASIAAALLKGSTLSDAKNGGSALVANFESDKSAAECAKLYREDKLAGGHFIVHGADPLSRAARRESSPRTSTVVAHAVEDAASDPILYLAISRAFYCGFVATIP
ncbi:hypothetical protein Ancab_031627 [Ancistrocladus abbreviatus]